MGSFIVDSRNEDAVLSMLDENCMQQGQLLPMPADLYKGISQNDLSLWCVRRGLYCLPTTELVEWLRKEIGGKEAIEIGSGNGCLGRALGIPRTDNKMQLRPDIASYYEDLGQGAVQYGPDVEKLSAGHALQKYDPKVVVAAWVTHRYNADQPSRGGNMWGVREEKIVHAGRKYIFVGHERVHAKKPILALKHRTFRPGWLYSRSPDPRNVIWVWNG